MEGTRGLSMASTHAKHVGIKSLRLFSRVALAPRFAVPGGRRARTLGATTVPSASRQPIGASHDAAAFSMCHTISAAALAAIALAACTLRHRTVVVPPLLPDVPVARCVEQLPLENGAPTTLARRRPAAVLHALVAPAKGSVRALDALLFPNVDILRPLTRGAGDEREQVVAATGGSSDLLAPGAAPAATEAVPNTQGASSVQEQLQAMRVAAATFAAMTGASLRAAAAALASHMEPPITAAAAAGGATSASLLQGRLLNWPAGAGAAAAAAAHAQSVLERLQQIQLEVSDAAALLAQGATAQLQAAAASAAAASAAATTTTVGAPCAAAAATAETCSVLGIGGIVLVTAGAAAAAVLLAAALAAAGSTLLLQRAPATASSDGGDGASRQGGGGVTTAALLSSPLRPLACYTWPGSDTYLPSDIAPPYRWREDDDDDVGVAEVLESSKCAATGQQQQYPCAQQQQQQEEEDELPGRQGQQGVTVQLTRLDSRSSADAMAVQRDSGAAQAVHTTGQPLIAQQPPLHSAATVAAQIAEPPLSAAGGAAADGSGINVRSVEGAAAAAAAAATTAAATAAAAAAAAAASAGVASTRRLQQGVQQNASGPTTSAGHLGAARAAASAALLQLNLLALIEAEAAETPQPWLSQQQQQHQQQQQRSSDEPKSSSSKAHDHVTLQDDTQTASCLDDDDDDECGTGVAMAAVAKQMQAAQDAYLAAYSEAFPAAFDEAFGLLNMQQQLQQQQQVSERLNMQQQQQQGRGDVMSQQQQQAGQPQEEQQAGGKDSSGPSITRPSGEAVQPVRQRSGCSVKREAARAGPAATPTAAAGATTAAGAGVGGALSAAAVAAAGLPGSAPDAAGGWLVQEIQALLSPPRGWRKNNSRGQNVGAIVLLLCRALLQRGEDAEGQLVAALQLLNRDPGLARMTPVLLAGAMAAVFRPAEWGRPGGSPRLLLGVLSRGLPAVSFNALQQQLVVRGLLDGSELPQHRKQMRLQHAAAAAQRNHGVRGGAWRVTPRQQQHPHRHGAGAGRGAQRGCHERTERSSSSSSSTAAPHGAGSITRQQERLQRHTAAAVVGDASVQSAAAAASLAEGAGAMQ